MYVLRYLQGTQKLMFWFQGNNDMCMITYDDDDDDVCMMMHVFMIVYDDIFIHKFIHLSFTHPSIHPSINSIHSSIYEFIHPFIILIDFSNAKDAEHYKKINDFLATSIHSNPGNYSDDDNHDEL